MHELQITLKIAYTGTVTSLTAQEIASEILDAVLTHHAQNDLTNGFPHWKPIHITVQDDISHAQSSEFSL